MEKDIGKYRRAFELLERLRTAQYNVGKSLHAEIEELLMTDWERNYEPDCDGQDLRM